MNLLPGIDNYLRTGFNLKKSENCNEPLFAFTFDQGATVDYGAQKKSTYTYPDQCDVTTVTDFNKYELDTTITSKRAFNSQYAIGVTVSGKDGVGDFDFSSSASVGLTGSNKTLNWSENEYFQSSYRCQTYSVTRNSLGQLDSDFENKLSSLKNIGNPSQDDFNTFFDQYGTHYIVSGDFGGQIVAATSIKKTLFSDASSSKVTSELSLSFNDLVASGSFHESDMFSHSSFLQENKSSISIEINAIGGLFNSDKSLYMTSCFGNPALLICPYGVSSQASAFEPITSLVSDADLKAAMEAALTQYLSIATYSIIEPLLPSPANTQILQTVDGFVIGAMNCLVNDGARGTLTGKTGSITAECSTHYYTGHDRWVSMASYMLPVLGGSSSVNTTNTTAGKPTFSLFQTQFQLDNITSFFGGQWSPVTSSPYAPASDGFLLVNAKVSQDGDRGRIAVADNSSSGILFGACSVHQYHDGDVWYPAESFCIPVYQGRSYLITSTNTSGSPTYSTLFLPLNALALALLGPQPLQENVAYQAETDVFLVCVLYASQDGARATASLVYADSSDEALKSANAQIGTSVHNYHTHNDYMEYNTAVLPVPKGRWYAANVDNTSGSVNTTIYFVPIVSARA